jgi:hypothetical protein
MGLYIRTRGRAKPVDKRKRLGAAGLILMGVGVAASCWVGTQTVAAETGTCATNRYGVGCEQTEIQAIDTARAAEGIKPLRLPADYNKLSPVEQLLVVTNAERVDRGLPGFAGLSEQLDRLAQPGAATYRDPTGLPDAIWGSNWAGGETSVLQADYDWMYNDGLHSANIDCVTASDAGCWGHRHNILGDYGPEPAMGAAVVKMAATSGPAIFSLAQLFAAVPPGTIAYKLPTDSR